MTRVRHSTFRDCTGIAIRETFKRDLVHDVAYPAVVVMWDQPYCLDVIMANYNLVFMVPVVTRTT